MRKKALQALRATLASALAQIDAIEEASVDLEALSAIREAIGPEAAPEQKTTCDHPKRKRLDARTMDDPEGWICGVCGQAGKGEEV